MLEYLEEVCKTCACQKRAWFRLIIEYVESAFQIEGVWSMKYSWCKRGVSRAGCVIVVLIDRSIMRRMKNGRDLVTYREAI